MESRNTEMSLKLLEYFRVGNRETAVSRLEGK